jgi:hypothetical protein
MEGKRGVYRDLVWKPERKVHLEDLGLDGKIILRWILRKWNNWAWSGSIWLRIRKGHGHL